MLYVVFVPWGAACTDWRVQDVEPSRWIAQAHPSQVRLERREGPRLQLRSPTVAGAEIRGLRGTDTLHVPVADVSRVAAKRTDWVETTLAIAGPPALPFGLACLLGCGY
jgi:hypothetical protein